MKKQNEAKSIRTENIKTIHAIETKMIETFELSHSSKFRLTGNARPRRWRRRRAPSDLLSRLIQLFLLRQIRILRVEVFERLFNAAHALLAIGESLRPQLGRGIAVDGGRLAARREVERT